MNTVLDLSAGERIELFHGDPRAACFHARFALEAALDWLYRFEGHLNQP